MFVIGEGTKAPGGTTIGQFGEGLKMAALVATRSSAASMEFHLPNHIVTFCLREVHGVQVLHAEINDGPDCEGFSVIIKMQGIAISFEGRILESPKQGPVGKMSPNAMRVYCKGVFISDMEYKSIWDWNLNELTINRDRSMVEKGTISFRGGDWLDDFATVEQFEEIVRNPDTVEGSDLIYWVRSDRGRRNLAEAFRNVHGEKGVLDMGESLHNIQAMNGGYKPIKVPDNMRDRLAGNIKTSEDVLPKHHDLIPVDADKYKHNIAWLRRLNDIIAAPYFSVRVFAVTADHLKGRADIEDMTVWLSEGLFTPGNDLELLRTYLHEAGHIMSSAKDATFEFENALDGIAGRLAMNLLGLKVSA
jgi:hypothetical protein